MKLKILLALSFFSGSLRAQEIDYGKETNFEKSLGVVEINAPDLTPSGVSVLTDILLEEIINVTDLRLYGRVIPLEAMESFELLISGFADEPTSKELNAILGLDFILSGKIGSLGNLFIITLKLTNVSERSVEDLIKREHEGPVETLGSTIKSMVNEMITRVASLSDRKVVFEENPKPVVPEVQNTTSESSQQHPEFLKTDAQKSLALFGTGYAVWVVNASLLMFDVEKERQYIGGTLVAAPIGFFIALNISKKSDFSVARTRMITSTTVWATYWGVTSIAILNPEDSSPHLAFSLTTGAVGLWASAKYSATHEITTSRVNFVNLGAFLGSLFGLGVPYLFDAQGDGIYMALMTLGGIAGGYTALKVSEDDSDYLTYDELAPGHKIHILGLISDLNIHPKIFYNNLEEKKLSSWEFPYMGLDISLKF